MDEGYFFKYNSSQKAEKLKLYGVFCICMLSIKLPGLDLVNSSHEEDQGILQCVKYSG